jgi:hypothetical protein
VGVQSKPLVVEKFYSVGMINHLLERAERSILRKSCQGYIEYKLKIFPSLILSNQCWRLITNMHREMIILSKQAKISIVGMEQWTTET